MGVKALCCKTFGIVLFAIVVVLSMITVAGLEILLVNSVLILAHSRAECLQTDNRWLWIALALVIFQLFYTAALWGFIRYMTPRFENPFTTQRYTPLA